MSKKEAFKEKLYSVIFEHDTPLSKGFDILLLWVIILSLLVVILETVQSIQMRYGPILAILEWTFTGLFTLEYIARIFVVRYKRRYIFSFYGLIDFFASIPMYLSLLVPGSGYLLSLRAIRLLRVFKILNLSKYVGESNALVQALKASRPKITIFMMTIFILVVFMGTLMYAIEGPSHGFTSIPRGMYWAVVTLTTVGYGDISPGTPLGQAVSSLIMVMGYAILAVPTGIVTVELSQVGDQDSVLKAASCPRCLLKTKEPGVNYCKNCGYYFKMEKDTIQYD